MSVKKYTYVSLFSGCGGFDYGFLKNKYQCLGAYDIDPVAVDTYNSNFGNFSTIYDLSKGVLPIEFHKNVDVVISGSPCQGFSTAGKRRIDDPRNQLLLAGGKIALSLNAKIFIAENVMGSLSGQHKIYWDELESLFTANEYNVKFIKCDATRLGLPQLRKRVLMIAWRGKADIEFDLPSVTMRSLKEILRGASSHPNHDTDFLCTNSDEYKIALKIGPGQKLSNVRGGGRSVHSWDIPEVFGEITDEERLLLYELMSLRRKLRVRTTGDADPVDFAHIRNKIGPKTAALLKSLISKGYVRKCSDKTYDLVHTFNGKYRRLSFDKPSPTVDTRFGSPKYFLHPTENRALSVREAARIQGFEDDFIFLGNKQCQYKMVGNAVPPPLSDILAKLLKNQLLPKL